MGRVRKKEGEGRQEGRTESFIAIRQKASVHRSKRLYLLNIDQ